MLGAYGCTLSWQGARRVYAAHARVPPSLSPSLPLHPLHPIAGTNNTNPHWSNLEFLELSLQAFGASARHLPRRAAALRCHPPCQTRDGSTASS